MRAHYKNRAQLLTQITHFRNNYVLKSPLLHLLKNAKTETEREFIKDNEVETYYTEQGIQTLPPYQMCERIYMAIRSNVDQGNLYDFY